MGEAKDREGDIEVKGRFGTSTIRFQRIAALASLADPGRTVVVADALTAAFLPPEFSRSRIVLVERGEAAKSLSSLERVYGAFLGLGVGRDWTVVGLGGGSLSDLAGFAASTWMRGLDFGFVPTTLLAMVDASVGGKNGLDFGGRKNLVGCVSQPRFVLVDTELLSGLPERDLARGMAEAIKHGVIDGEDHLALVEGAVSASGTIDTGALEAIIRRSVALKAAIAGEDEGDEGPRRRLNLGHTFGHGLEAAAGLPHGDCVAAGIASAFRLAVERGGSEKDAARVITLIERLSLPAGIEAARRLSPTAGALGRDEFRDAVCAAMASDKKRSGDDIMFAMPRKIGEVRVEALALEEISRFARRAP